MGTVFCFRKGGKKGTFKLLHRKKNRDWSLIFSMKVMGTFFFLWWKSIFVRKDFQIFCSQCHSRTRSAVYADNTNP